MALSKQRVSKSPAAAPWEYDVFISFKGEDTRNNFTDDLYEKLVERAIKTFRDDHELERGTTISLKLLNAIEESWFAIIVLSPNYASSTWCLAELSHIVECMEDRKTILPIFYHVDPSHVRKQTGIFAQAFNKHEKTFMNDTEKVQRWRTALTKVGNMLGWISKDRYKNDLIKEIVDTICHKVHPTCTLLGSRKILVGIEFRLKKIDSLLDLEANDVHFIGIWGEGGTGKTTLARLVYEGISHNFEICRFIGNVKEVSAALQKVTQVWDAYSASNMAKKCFCKKKVLLVIDEVEELNQLETLAGKKNGYGPGSRIIITTRNKRLLVEYLIDKPYELLGLHENESSQLCHWKALKREEREEKQLLDEESQSEDGHEQPAQLHLAEGESSSKLHPYQHYLTFV
ncbi:unnamed protein product [Malus baccata var. baccata]